MSLEPVETQIKVYRGVFCKLCNKMCIPKEKFRRKVTSDIEAFSEYGHQTAL